MALTPEQIELRRSCLGGSDIARIVCHCHGGLMGVCADKWGTSPYQTPGMEAELGQLGEPGIVEWATTQEPFADTHSSAFHAGAGVCRVRGPYPIAVNCDCIVDDGEHHHSVPLSAKLVFHYGMRAWEDGPSQYAQVQLQTEMACTDAGHGFVAAWFVSTGEKKLWRIERDQEAIEAIIELARDVWSRYVLPHKLPPIDETNGELAFRVLSKFPRLAGTETQIEAPEVLAAVAVLDNCRVQQALARKTEPQAKAIILAALGDATIGRLPDGRSIILKTITKKAYEVEASEFIQISVKGDSNVGTESHAVSDAETIAA